MAIRKFSLSQEERRCLREFFDDLLFTNMGAYVLCGRKPMSLSCLEQPFSEEEKKEWDEYYSSLPENERSEYTLRRYNYFENYAKWENIRQRFDIKHYLFGRYPSRFSDKTEIVIFANIELVVKTLLKYYPDFRRVLGFDFDPLLVVYELEDPNSVFWNGVMDHHVLLGILLGFGQENSWFFQWNSEYEKSDEPIAGFLKSLPSRVYEEKYIDYPTSSNFPLPIYGSYGFYPEDEHTFEEYKKDRKRIKAIYRSRDEVDVSLSWLTR